MSTSIVPPHFYQVAANSRAAFSTHNGTKPKRELPDPLPMPVIRTNIKGDVEARADQLIKDFPGIACRIVDEPDWWGLHDYFDGYDLWIEGPDFCFFVAITIARKNQEQARRIQLEQQERACRIELEQKEQARLAKENALILEQQQAMIREVAEDWVEYHQPLVFHNRHIPDLTVFFDEVDKTNFIDMRPEEVNYFKTLLNFYRDRLLARLDEQSRILAERHRGPVPPFGGPPMFGPQQPGLYTGYQLGQGPMMPLPGQLTLRQQRGGSMASMGPRSVVEQRSGHCESFSNQAHRQAPVYSIHPSRQPYILTGPAADGYLSHNRQRGFSNASRDGRGFHRNSISNNHNNRRQPENTLRGSPHGNTPTREPVYILHSPRNIPAPVSVTQRNNSEPIPAVPSPYRNQAPGGHYGSPSGHRHVSHNSANYISPPSQMTLQTAQRSVSSSASLQTATMPPLPLPSKAQVFSNDARVSTGHHEPQTTGRVFSGTHDKNSVSLRSPVPTSSGDAYTMYYLPPRGKDHENVRTVHVFRFSEDAFRSHVIKDIMEECGQVESVHYLASNGRTFVTFVEHASVERAILRWNGADFHGCTLNLSVPNTLRDRSGSNASHYPHGDQRDYDPHQRRMSNRTSNYNGPAHSRQPSVGLQTNGNSPAKNSFEDSQLRSQATEVAQHQTAMKNYVQQHFVLGNVANRSNGKSSVDRPEPKIYMQQGTVHPGSDMKKENVAPGKSAASVSKYPKNNKKGSKQNTSARPTPAASPVKSLSAADSKDPSFPENSAPASVKIHLHQSQGGKKKNKSSAKKIIDTSRSEASFTTDATMQTATSPADSTPMTRDTSFSSIPSRKPSVATETPSIPRSQSAIELPSHSSSKNTASKAKPKQRIKSHEPKLEVKNAELSAAKMLVPIPKGFGVPETKGVTKSDPLSHSKHDSNISTASKSPKRNSDIKFATSLVPEQVPVMVAPLADEKMEMKASITPSSGLLTVGVSSKSSANSLKVDHWPILALAKPPNIDSKLPPPVTGPLTAASKDGKKKKLVPAVAVPRAFETRPQPSTYELGTKTWPFVRNTRPK
ncbi:hypothetical protein LZ554_000891 [Drepanopeziza brunnea f. sp. 'monogermtubi']|nr:hypothetical protein LZ554_000891 [Drepanopeziza brunnea f. sp. 'monogermtubi']